jgi:hypothetical protein
MHWRLPSGQDGGFYFDYLERNLLLNLQILSQIDITRVPLTDKMQDAIVTELLSVEFHVFSPGFVYERKQGNNKKPSILQFRERD